MRGGATPEAPDRQQAVPVTGVAGLLGWPDFRRFWIVGCLANLGRWMEMVILGWVVVELTDSVWLVALVGFFRNVPMLLAGALAGEAADRFGRRRVALFGDALAASVSLCLGLLLLSGERSFVYLAAGAFGLGIFYAIEHPTRRAQMADLVGRSALMRAVSLDVLSQNLMRVIGPLAGGAILKGIDPGIGFLLLALNYAAAFLLLRRVRFPGGGGGGRGGGGIGFVESLHLIRHNRIMLALLGVTVTMNALVFPYQSLLPAFAHDTLGVDAFGLGLLSAAVGVGSIAGSTLLARAPRLPQGLTFLTATLLTAVSVLLFSTSRDLWPAAVLLAVGGFTQTGFSTMQSATLLHTAPEALRGRAAGWLTVAIGAGPLGVLAVGALATVVGAPLALGATAGAAIAVIALQTLAAPKLRAYRWRDD